MSDSPPKAARDPVQDQVAEACLRLVVGAVPSKAIAALRAEILAQPDAYPWQAVNDRLVAGRMEPDELLERALRWQRDWILRGGASAGRRPRRSLRTRGKGVLAFALSRLLFFAFYTGAVVVLLLLLKHRWPGVDVYLALDWLGERIPGIFGGR